MFSCELDKYSRVGRQVSDSGKTCGSRVSVRLGQGVEPSWSALRLGAKELVLSARLACVRSADSHP